MEVKYWLVSAVNSIAGTLCIKPFSWKELSVYQQLCKVLNDVHPNEHWTICTNECPTIFPEQGVRFVNGRFIKL